MNEPVTGGLGEALRERLLDRVRLLERAQALESHPPASGAGRNRTGDSEAVLRQALRALGDAQCFRMAGQVLAGEAAAAGGVGEWLALQELAQAGLASWDLGTGKVEPTPLLRELHALLAAAIDEAAR
ncbi:MAG TPA: hypothetical protein VMU89_08235 [Thermomicrobiaceae bacterium]|nr:hypothetical protein [Thermomicrobiaceae bacterium]